MSLLEQKPQKSQPLILAEDDGTSAPDQTYLERIKNTWNDHSWKIIIGAIVVVILYFLLIRSGVFVHLIMALNSKLNSLYDTHPFFVICVLFVLMVSVVCFCYFSHAAMCILVASILKNFWLSVFFLLISSVAGSAVIFYVSHLICRNWILRKLEKNDFFQVLQEESHTAPYKTAFLARLLFIPAGMKDYILTVIDNPAGSFFVSSAAVHLFYIIESCLVAEQFKEIRDMFGEGKSWDQKSAIEKFSFIMVMFVLVFTIVFIIVLGKWATQRIKDKKRQMSIELMNLKDKA